MKHTWSIVAMALLWLAASVMLGKESTADAGTAEHGTAEHGTAEHGTAEHGTAEHGTADAGYVLLHDGSVLRGTVDEEPGRVIIRHEGSQIRLTRDRVACWADTLDGLYQFQLDRRRIFTVEVHVDAARWCLRHGLHERAAAELIAAMRIDAHHPEVQRAARELRVAAEREQTASRTASADTAASVAKTGTAAGEALAEPNGERASARFDRVDASMLREFTADVQPLLSNRCNGAACHGSESSAAFRLSGETQDRRRPSAVDTRRNLQAAMAWVDRDDPSASPLLVRALESHGGANAPPLGVRDQAAVENFRRWINSLATRSDDFSPREPQEPQLAAQDAGEAPLPSAAASDARLPVRLPGVEDPFDPELFNRRFRTP